MKMESMVQIMVGEEVEQYLLTIQQTELVGMALMV